MHDLSSWDVSAVFTMEAMFVSRQALMEIFQHGICLMLDQHMVCLYCSSFNQDISGWDMSNVTDPHNMFTEQQASNQDISGWNMSSATYTGGMFAGASSFNQDISGWDMSNVGGMQHMFRDAISFNQDLSNWNVSGATSMTSIFDNTPAMSEENKCAIHTTWSLNSNWAYEWSGYCSSGSENFALALMVSMTLLRRRQLI